MTEDISPNQALVTLLTQWQEMLREGTSEYELIRVLQAPPLAFFSEQAMRDPLLLFQTHFALYNALYQLRDDWLANQQGLLEITGTRIHLHDYEPQAPGLTSADPLREYYLNWNNFDKTGKQDVEAMLDAFWTRMATGPSADYASPEKVSRARATLDIGDDLNLTRELIKRQYRKRLHECHPDKGGRAEDTRQIVSAYMLLITSLP